MQVSVCPKNPTKYLSTLGPSLYIEKLKSIFSLTGTWRLPCAWSFCLVYAFRIFTISKNKERKKERMKERKEREKEKNIINHKQSGSMIPVGGFPFSVTMWDITNIFTEI